MSAEEIEREEMEFDVLIVGGGPAGLSAAIRLRQAAAEAGRDLSVCVVEKGSEIGAHILSGAVIETRALEELFPDWKTRGAPVSTAVSEDRFLFLTENRAVALPTPPTMHNAGNYVVSLGSLCRWLAERAEELGADIFPGFAAAEPLIEDGRVVGVTTGDMGRLTDGEPGPNFQPGVNLRARVTLVAEGCRGSLAQDLISRFRLDEGRASQTYGLGIKELWDVDPARHKPGLVMHSVGWPLSADVYGGSFVYHAEGGQVAIGFVVGLDYRNPFLSPFEEFQRFKTHPAIRGMLQGGKRVGFGARALAEGGWQALPKLTFPGGALIGDCAGFVNVPKVKGTHTAMMSGILAADAALTALAAAPDDARGVTPERYPLLVEDSWIATELKSVRNIRPAFRWGLWGGMAYAALDTYVLRGHAPWTLGHHADHERLIPAAQAKAVAYPKPDGVLTFDRASSVYLANTTHDEAQPVHLHLADQEVPVAHNLAIFNGPEERYCPAGVYEFDRAPVSRLRINAANCVHCKTCDIKDPRRNIHWTVPEGGSGPNYPNM